MTKPRGGDQALKTAIAAALRCCGPGKSICPSEVARSLGEDWRPLMPEVRRVAQVMADRGEVMVTRKGRSVRADTAGGPVRLSLP